MFFFIFSISFLLQLLKSLFAFTEPEPEDEFLTGIERKFSLLEDEIVLLREELRLLLLLLRNEELKMLPIFLHLSAIRGP